MQSRVYEIVWAITPKGLNISAHSIFNPFRIEKTPSIPVPRLHLGLIVFNPFGIIRFLPVIRISSHMHYLFPELLNFY